MVGLSLLFLRVTRQRLEQIDAVSNPEATMIAISSETGAQETATQGVPLKFQACGK